MMPFACNDPSMISPMMILSSLIWVENCENCKLTSSFETILGLFARIDGNVCELWELTVEEVWVFDITWFGGGGGKKWGGKRMSILWILGQRRHVIIL